jgi:hypothetical protein
VAIYLLDVHRNDKKFGTFRFAFAILTGIVLFFCMVSSSLSTNHWSCVDTWFQHQMVYPTIPIPPPRSIERETSGSRETDYQSRIKSRLKRNHERIHWITTTWKTEENGLNFDTLMANLCRISLLSSSLANILCWNNSINSLPLQFGVSCKT